MIPKTIHYCWFGKNPKPKLAEKCIRSWKKYCKGYQIIEWNEDNFSIEDAPLYVRQAYEAKKWAFVTDYVRLYVMVNFGGIYMDTDVEVVKPLDPFLKHQAFSGFENETNIPTGIMACEKGFPLFDMLLNYYDDVVFVREDGSYDNTTNVEIITNTCVNRGLQRNNQFQIIDGFALYPRDVFCPGDPCAIDVKKTQDTVTIHWFAGSWLPEDEKEEKRIWMELERKKKQKARIKHLKQMPKQILKKVLGEKNYDTLKRHFIK